MLARIAELRSVPPHERSALQEQTLRFFGAIVDEAIAERRALERRRSRDEAAAQREDALCAVLECALAMPVFGALEVGRQMAAHVRSRAAGEEEAPPGLPEDLAYGGEASLERSGLVAAALRRARTSGIVAPADAWRRVPRAGGRSGRQRLWRSLLWRPDAARSQASGVAPKEGGGGGGTAAGEASRPAEGAHEPDARSDAADAVLDLRTGRAAIETSRVDLVLDDGTISFPSGVVRLELQGAGPSGSVVLVVRLDGTRLTGAS